MLKVSIPHWCSLRLNAEILLEPQSHNTLQDESFSCLEEEKVFHRTVVLEVGDGLLESRTKSGFHQSQVRLSNRKEILHFTCLVDLCIVGFKCVLTY